MSATDLLLEVEIDRAFDLVLAAPTPELKRVYFQQMRELIAQRSADQIERMERERGLR